MKNKNEDFKEELETQYSILIKTEKKEQQKITIIILIILFITLASTLISLLFSYKSYKNSKNVIKDQIEQKTYYQTLTTTYSDNEKIEIAEIINGYYSTPKTITITNEGDADIIYDIKITAIKTSLLSNTNLVYNITESNEVSIDRALPLKETSILESILIHPKETKSYIINIKNNGYVEPETINYYYGNITIEQNINKTNLLK